LALFGVSIPLPFWNRREGDLEAARAEVARQQAERERVLARIDKEVTTAFRQFLTARQVVAEYVQQIVPAQEQNARLVEQGYRIGQLRLTEALLAQRDFIETRTTYLDAIAAHNAARAELQKAAAVRP
jgi:cobalt-zinc-cadmium efflux system outer membrane protein